MEVRTCMSSEVFLLPMAAVHAGMSVARHCFATDLLAQYLDNSHTCTAAAHYFIHPRCF